MRFCLLRPRFAIFALCATLFSSAISNADEATAQLLPTGTYGIDNLLLENQWLRAIINPHEGGRIISLVDKESGTELAAGTGIGLIIPLESSTLNGQYPGPLAQTKHQFSITAAAGPEATVELTASLPGSFAGVELRKTFHLTDDRRLLTMTVTLTNTGYTARQIALRSHNWLSTPGDDKVPFCRYLTGNGIETEIRKFRDDFAAGWMSFEGKDAPGILCGVLYDEAARMMCWPSHEKGSTFEVVTRNYMLEAGQVAEIPFWFAPLPADFQTLAATPEAILGRLDHKLTLIATGPESRQAALISVNGKTLWQGQCPEPSLPVSLTNTDAWAWLECGETRTLAPLGHVPVITRPMPNPPDLRQLPAKPVNFEPKSGAAMVLDDGHWIETEESDGSRFNRKLRLANGTADWSLNLTTKRTETGFSSPELRFAPAGAAPKAYFLCPRIAGLVLDTVPEVRPIRSSAGIGFDLLYGQPGNRVIQQLRLPPVSNTLFVRVSAEDSQEKALTQVLTVYPGGLQKPRDRQVLTAEGAFAHDWNGTLPDAAQWCFFYDKIKDLSTDPRASGPVGICFAGAAGRKVRAAVSEYTSSVRKTVSHGPILLALRDFKGLTNEAAEQLWKAEREAVASALTSKELFSSEVSFEPRHQSQDDVVRILQLSRWAFGEVSGPDKAFPEIAAVMEHARKHNFGSSPAAYYAKAVYDQRFAFHAQDFLAYYLDDDPRFAVDTVYENNFPGAFQNLFNYDVLAIVDFPAAALASFLPQLRQFAADGGTILFCGGYAAFGGRHEDYGDYRALDSLLPVQLQDGADWLDQDTYAGEFEENNWHSAAFFTSPVTGERIRRFGPVIHLGLHQDWMHRGTTAKATEPLHPAVAGIPLELISPSYHRVKLREGSRQLATVGKDPLLVTRTLGKGRTVALTLSDFRKLWAWEFSRPWLKQMLRWCGKKSAANPVASLATAPDRIMITVRAGAGCVHNTLTLDIRSEELEYVHSTAWKLKIEPEKEWQVELELDSAQWLPGLYRGTLRLDQHVLAVTDMEIRRPLSADLDLSFMHRSHFTPGQVIQPVLTGHENFAAETILHIRLRDSRSKVVDKIALNGIDAAQWPGFSSEGLAFGKYAVAVEAELDGKILAYASAPCQILPRQNIEVPVTMYGFFTCPKMSASTWTGLAMAERLSETFNLLACYQESPSELLDRSQQFGLQYLIRPAYLGPVNASDPAAMKVLREKMQDTAPFISFPAVYGCYLDDEGWGRAGACYGNWGGEPDPHQAKTFLEQYGFNLPAKPETLEQQVQVADFYIDEYSRKVKVAVEAGRAVNPAWKQVLIQTAVRPAAIGGWPARNFEHVDSIWMDIYPATVGDIGEQLLFGNLMRTMQRNTGKPAWQLMGEYRETADACRMQVWLTLMAGLKGYGWYSIGAIRRLDYPEISRLTRMLRDYGPFISRLEAPGSPVALLFLKSCSAWWGPESNKQWKHLSSYYQQLQKLCLELARHDVAPDIITEEDIERGRLNNYETVIMTGEIEELPPETLRALTDFANHGQLAVTPGVNVDIPAAAPWNPELQLAGLTHQAYTPDTDIISGMLNADGQPCLVVYNHSRQPADTEIVFQDQTLSVAAVAGRNSLLQLEPAADQQRNLRIRLDGYDGAWIALLPAPITGMTLDLAAAQRGRPFTIGVTLNCDKALNGILPLQLRITRSDGYEFSMDAMARCGFAAVTIPCAVNDPAGMWQVDVVERFTGINASKSFTVE